jgi:amidophosphoribosyltransferase
MTSAQRPIVPLRRQPIEDDHFHDQCGLFGIFGHPDASHLAYMGLYALQHRGQESAGIACADGAKIRLEKGMGLVNDVFTAGRLESLVGDRAIGHVRYSTSGDTVPTNAQPYLIECHRGPIAVGHNGNLTNAAILRQELEAAGSIFQSTSDTEVILHLYARSHRERLEDAIAASLYKVMGAFSLLFLTPEAMVAARDPWGFRPLVLGKLGNATVLASETCALDLIEAEYVRDVEPGEVLVVDAAGIRSFKPFPPEPTAHCVFEHVYFARPDSLVSAGRRSSRGSRSAASWRASSRPTPTSSARCPTAGWARRSASRGERAALRVGPDPQPLRRPHLHPAAPGSRSVGVRIKLNPVRHVPGPRVVLIDDSIVRGTTSRKIVRMVREAGAREVHLRISCPPTTGPCYYGIDTPLKSELIAASHGVDEIRRYVEADSLGYLSHEGLLQAAGDAPGRRHCTACFSGRYPVAVTQLDESQLRLFEKARA